MKPQRNFFKSHSICHVILRKISMHDYTKSKSLYDIKTQYCDVSFIENSVSHMIRKKLYDS